MSSILKSGGKVERNVLISNLTFPSSPLPLEEPPYTDIIVENNVSD